MQGVLASSFSALAVSVSVAARTVLRPTRER
jgi:hypothetical protein